MAMGTLASAGSPCRVLIVVQNLPVPFDRRVWLEATTLARAGHRVSVICPKAKGFNRSFEVLEDVHIHRYALPVDADGPLGFVVEFLWCFVRTAMKSVRVAVSGRGFDVLHVCNPPETYWPLGRFWKLFGKRFLFDHHDLSPEMYQAKFGATGGLALAGLRYLERKTFETADLVITTNQSHQRIAVERGGMAPADVYVVRSGPDLDRLTVYPPDPAWRKGRRHLIVYLGEICEQDGVDHLVRAVKLLRDELGRDDVHCVLRRWRPAPADHQGVRGGARRGRAVHLHRPGQRRRALSRPVLRRPRGRSGPEERLVGQEHDEQDHGVPVLRAPGRRLRPAPSTGSRPARRPRSSEPNRERALACGISELLDDPARRRRMGELGRERVRTTLAWEHSAPVLLAAYDRLWPASGPGASSASRRASEWRRRSPSTRSDRVLALEHWPEGDLGDFGRTWQAECRQHYRGDVARLHQALWSVRTVLEGMDPRLAR